MQKQIIYKGKTVFYSKSGAGKPVILLHGFGEDSRIWKEIREDIAKDNLLIIPDLPGSGRSEMLDGEAEMDDYAGCIKAISEEESLSEIVMIGHSMGGYITLAYAELYADDVKAIGLFHSSAYADDDQKKETRNKAIEFIKQNGAEAFLKTSIPGLFKNPEKSKNEINILLERGKLFKPEALIQYYQAMIKRPDRTDILKDRSKTFLYIMGEHDKAVPFEQSLQQTHLSFHSYVHILRNSAHMGILEESGKSVQILANFLHDIDDY